LSLLHDTPPLARWTRNPIHTPVFAKPAAALHRDLWSFLFDMGVFVFLVKPPAGQLDLLLLAPPLQMPVDELRAVVRIHSPQRKR